MKSQPKRAALASKGAAENIDALLDEVFVELRQSPRETMPKIHRALDLSHKQKYNKGIARALLAEGIAEYLLSNYDESFLALQDANARFEKHCDKQGIATVRRTLGAIYIRQGAYDQARTEFEAAKQLYQALGDELNAALLVNNLAGIDERAGNFKDALNGFLESADIFERLGDGQNHGASLSNAAVLFEHLGDYQAALDYALKSLHQIEKNGNTLHAAAVFNTLASLSIKLGNLDAATDYALTSKKLFEAAGEKYGIATALTMLGEVRQKRHQFSESLQAYRDAYTLRQALQDRWGEADALMRIGQLYRERQKWNDAKEAYQTALGLFEQGHEKPRIAEAQLELAKILLEKKRYKQAETLLLDALQLAESSAALEQLAPICKALSELYAKRAHFDAAYHYHQRFFEAEQKLNNAERLKQLRVLQMRFDVQRLQDERRFFERKAEKLEHDMTRKQKELLTLTMSLAKKNQCLQTLYESLGRTQTGSRKKMQRDLQKIMRDVKLNLRSEETWKLFEMHFSELHQTFLRTLSERYPALTGAETKVAAMLRLNLSTKEIAALLYTSERTVESHRQNLRKKLQLGAEMGLHTFLSTL